MLFGKKSKNKCANCGAILAPNALFCVECGKKVKTEKKVDAPLKKSQRLKYCPNCKSKITVLNSSFCMNCGYNLRRQEDREKNCPNCGEKIIPNSSFCVKCGEAITGKKKISTSGKNDDSKFDDSESTGMLEESSAYEEDFDDNEATSLLGDFPTIVRLSTGEKVTLNKPVIKIGKQRTKVDFCIVGNNTVSRVHVKIFSKSGKYFIWDNNSRNGTYVNGDIIPPEMETMLADGDIIKLSDEEFEFRL